MLSGRFAEDERFAALSAIADSSLERAVAALRVSIDRLARHLDLTRRHLERRFQAVVGISPKRLARIARFQRALRMLERDGRPQRGVRIASEQPLPSAMRLLRRR